LVGVTVGVSVTVCVGVIVGVGVSVGVGVGDGVGGGVGGAQYISSNLSHPIESIINKPTAGAVLNCGGSVIVIGGIIAEPT
jgi:hypothetical protein